LEFLRAVFLAIIQGVTEFLPISSSAHLILPSQILGWPDQGLAFDTAVHLGSLIAVIWYFRLDITRLVAALQQSFKTKQLTDEGKFAVNLFIASLPILPVGFLLRFEIEQHLRSVEVIAITTALFAALLLIADRWGGKRSHATELNWSQALLIGVSQCLALIPGTSRSGITMTTALLAGFSREGASRISFLISIPTIASAGTLKLFDLFNSPQPVNWTLLVTGCFLSMISAYLCIKFFMMLITRVGFLPFVIYRLLLAGLLMTFIVW
jgi:undecaprenyl-diphosphatase